MAREAHRLKTAISGAKIGFPNLHTVPPRFPAAWRLICIPFPLIRFSGRFPPPLFFKRISTPKGNHCVQHPKMLRIPLIPLNFVCVCVCYAWLNVFFLLRKRWIRRWNSEKTLGTRRALVTRNASQYLNVVRDASQFYVAKQAALLPSFTVFHRIISRCLSDVSRRARWEWFFFEFFLSFHRQSWRSRASN